MVLGDPPPLKPPPGYNEEKAVPFKMQGKILKKDKCRYCSGSYVLIQPQGEEGTRLFHSKPECAKFKEDVQAYWAWHNMTRKERRATKSARKGRAVRGGRGRGALQRGK